MQEAQKKTVFCIFLSINSNGVRRRLFVGEPHLDVDQRPLWSQMRLVLGDLSVFGAKVRQKDPPKLMGG